MTTQHELYGKRVVVTGACGIIGLWISEALHKAGAKLCLTDARAADLTLLNEKLGLSGDSFTHVCDLTDACKIQSLADAVAEKWGSPDIVINNAGIYPSSFLLDMSVEDWDSIFDINLRAPFILTRAMALLMVKQGVRGNIVNISSGAARKMRRTVVPYCVSKTALDRLTKGFALELAEYGIRVNALEPGFAAGSAVSNLTEDHINTVTNTIPLGRASSAQDVTEALFFLASDRGSYVTGATLTVDGGNSAGVMTVFQEKRSAL